MATLEEMIASLKKLDVQNIGEKVAKRAETTLQEAVAATLALGEGPEGESWAPRKEDGGRAYAHASSRIQTKAFGTLVRMTLIGPEVYGHFGRGKSQAPRKMIPDAGAGMPKSVDRALETAAEEVFKEATK